MNLNIRTTAIEQSQPAFSFRFQSYVKENGFLKVRPILYLLEDNTIDLNTLLQSKRNNLPLGSAIVNGSSIGFVKSVKWSWEKLPKISLTQLLGVYCVYLYTLNCAYNAGRKVTPFEKQINEKNKVVVTKWNHHLIAYHQVLPCSEFALNASFSNDDLREITKAINAICVIETAANVQIEAIRPRNWLKSYKDSFNLTRLFDNDFFAYAQKSYCDYVTFSKINNFLLRIDSNCFKALPTEKVMETIINVLDPIVGIEGIYNIFMVKLAITPRWFVLYEQLMGKNISRDALQRQYEKWRTSSSIVFSNSLCPESESMRAFFYDVLATLEENIEPLGTTALNLRRNYLQVIGANESYISDYTINRNRLLSCEISLIESQFAATA